MLPQKYYDVKAQPYSASALDSTARPAPSEEQIRRVLAGLDTQSRWMSKHVAISNPYAGDGKKTEPTDAYASTNVGDETDTSPYRDTSDRDYISTRAFIMNMTILMDYVKAVRAGK